jgi:hypothetical protein
MFPLGMGGSKKRHDVSVWSSASTVSALPLLEELSFAIVKGSATQRQLPNDGRTGSVSGCVVPS